MDQQQGTEADLARQEDTEAALGRQREAEADLDARAEKLTSDAYYRRLDAVLDEAFRKVDAADHVTNDYDHFRPVAYDLDGNTAIFVRASEEHLTTGPRELLAVSRGASGELVWKKTDDEELDHANFYADLHSTERKLDDEINHRNFDRHPDWYSPEKLVERYGARHAQFRYPDWGHAESVRKGPTVTAAEANRLSIERGQREWHDGERRLATWAKTEGATSQIREKVRGVVTWGPQTTWKANERTGLVQAQHARVVLWDCDAQKSRVVMFPPNLATWAAQELETGRAVELSHALVAPKAASPAEGRAWDFWALEARSLSAAQRQGLESTPVPPPMPPTEATPSNAHLLAEFAAPTTSLNRRDGDTRSLNDALSEQSFQVQIPEKLSPVAQLALDQAPKAIRDLGLRAGFVGKVPAALSDDVLLWCGGNEVPINFSRVQKHASLMPDHDAGPSLAKIGVKPTTLEHPRFRDTLKANELGDVFALQRGPHGPSGIAYVPLSPFKDGRIVSGEAGLWVSNTVGKDEKIVIVNSPVMALAHHQLRPTDNVRYVATGSSTLDDTQKAALTSLLAAVTANNRGLPPQILVATSRDREGQLFAREIMDACPVNNVPRREVPPCGRSWTEATQLKNPDLVRAAGGPPPAEPRLGLR
jgi:hypothetical protein